VIDDPTRDRLHALVRRESRSLMQYVREVPLWVAGPDRETFGKLRALAGAELKAVDALGKLLLARKAALSFLGPFPSEYSSFNDMALKHLLPILVREQRKALADLEADLPHVADAEAAALVKGLVELKRQHLAELEAMTVRPHVFTKAPV
jgi:hypothetical protein